MTHRYIPQDLVDEIKEAYRLGIPFFQIVERTGIEAEQLRNIIGLPQWRSEPASDDCDLWRSDELQERL